MSAGDVDVVRRAWSAVPHGATDTVRDLLDPDVRWYGADEPEGGCHDRHQVLAFLQRASEDGVTAEALEIRDAGRRVVAIVRTRHPPEWGDQPDPHGEVVTVRDGRIVEMVVHPDVDGALRAVRGDDGLRAERRI